MGYGSTGVLLSGTGAPSLHDDTITGGIAAVGNSAGIQSSTSLRKAGSNPLMHLMVSGVDVGSLVLPGFSAGIRITGSASADILDCEVFGNDSPGATAVTSADAIQFKTSGNALLVGDRLYGGAGSTTSGTDGVAVLQGGQFEMDNCMIHGGEGTQGNAVATSAATATLNFDTIYENGLIPPMGSGGLWGYAIAAHDGAVSLHNLLILNASPGMAALFEESCPGALGGGGSPPGPGTFNTIDHVVFGDFVWSDYCRGNPFNCGFDSQPLVTMGNTYLGTGGNQSAITFLPASRCSGSCSTALFGSAWGSDDGLAALFSNTQGDAGVAQKGWTFATPPPCLIATGGTPVTGVRTDINGTTRSSLPSIGATEVVGPCTP
jgi:hypothetical protein